MSRIFNTRLLICIIVSVISAILVIPTVRYFAFVDTHVGVELTPEEARRAAEMREKSIKLGLDLQGGVDFLLAMDVPRVRQAYMEQMADQIRRHLAQDRVAAEVTLTSELRQIHVKLADRKDAEIAQRHLKDYEDFFERTDFSGLRAGQQTFVLQNAVLSDYMRTTLEGALRVVRKRVDEFGLTQPVVARQGDERIRVQIPGETDPDTIERNLLRPATLEFRLLHPNMAEIVRPLVQEGTFRPGMGTGVIRDEFLEETLSPSGYLVKTLREAIPGIPPGYVLRLGEDSRTDHRSGVREITKNLVYIVKDEIEVRGDMLKDARPRVIQQDLENPFKVSLEFDREGTRRFAEVTRQHVGEPFAIILEDTVYSAPVIRTPIPDGRCVIEGNFTLQDVRELSQVLKAGALPAPLRVIEKRAVEASLGADSILASTKALGLGGLFLIVFMIFYYGKAGVVSVVAMALNVLLIMGFLTMANATLTLSGIGGILLTMGLAVDANVLIYERLREELATKKPIKAAISQAFGRALTVIFDSNITSLLPALALLLFEVVEGSVKGFWITLAVGLVANLYTGVTVTRALTETWLNTTGSFSAGKFTWFRNPKIPFMKLRFGGYVFSGALMVLSLGYLAIHGINFAVDFTGGVMAHVQVEKELNTDDIRRAMAGVDTGNVAVQKVLNKDEFLIRTRLQADATGEISLAHTSQNLRAALNTALADANVSIISVDEIAGEVGDEFRAIAIKTILVASLCILLYIGFRFQPIFGFMAVIAVCHDLILTLGLFTILGREVNLDIVSALLMILGYSVNDTIVIFDRIRELANNNYGKNFRAIVDQGINMSLNRTVNTSGSTLVMVLAMILLGGKGLADFALILFIGVFFGTYSSAFVASALAYDWIRRRTIKEEQQKQEARLTGGRLARATK